MFLGYNTNGLAHHDLFDAVELIAEIGYEGVAITIDHGPLSPYCGEVASSLGRLKKRLDALGLRSVIETGARYLLDPRRKHEPTLVTPDPAEWLMRVEFYRHAIRCASALGSDCVSLWSGSLGASVDSLAAEDASRDAAMERLCEGLAAVLDSAARRGVSVAFEPEPGMFIDTMLRYDELCRRLGRDGLRLTLDLGHLHCQGEPIAQTIGDWPAQLANVHIEDMRRGTHEHLMFGEGEIDFAPVVQALADSGYEGGVYVELSRHSHLGPMAAKQAFEFLTPLIKRTNPRGA
jgi:sugar phosphate isomerase/epimerase